MTETPVARHSSPDGEPFLVVEDLTVRFPTEDGLVSAVTGLSYSLELGKTLGIVGESGSGKSVSSMAVLGLHDAEIQPDHRLDPGGRPGDRRPR
ncbi:MAG: ATP-binding cassette domain-containing protein [Nocardioides sp.]